MTMLIVSFSSTTRTCASLYLNSSLLSKALPRTGRNSPGLINLLKHCHVFFNCYHLRFQISKTCSKWHVSAKCCRLYIS